MNPAHLDLPATGTEQPPLFTNLTQCRAWQQALPMSSPLQAQTLLLKQLQLLSRYALAGEARLALLEALRETIYFLQTESAKKFSGKPLPLAPPEQMALAATHEVWQALATGYLHCLDACLAGQSALANQAALVCQRALAALADDHADLVRAGSHAATSHWRRAHALYVSAELLGVTKVAVADPVRIEQPMTPAAVYVELFLLAAASLHELPARQQAWVARWARQWAGKVEILAAPPPDAASALPLCVDLDSESPASYLPLSGTGARWLETSALRKSLKVRIERLARGGPDDTPAKLGLGEDCAQSVCSEVLRRVYPRWVKGGIQRRHERHPISGACRFVAGVDAAHYYISGHQPFKPPGHAAAEELRRQREELATFGRVANRFMDDYSINHGYEIEKWESDEDWGLDDQSSGGLRLVRPLAQSGGRLGIGQLVAIQPADASSFQLGVVRWAQVRGERLVAGIKLFPGKPYPVAVRGTGVMAERELYRPGFYLPAVESVGSPASLVLPPGSFKPNRIMEAWAEEGSLEFKLSEVLDRGADFERVGGIEK